MGRSVVPIGYEYNQMKRNQLSFLAGLALATTTLGQSAHAQVRSRRARPAVDPAQASVQLCLMDSSGTKGIFILPTHPRFQGILMQILGAKVVSSTEHCDTEYDDDCDGLVNEGCPTSFCGDGRRDDDEQCDDGNTDSGDGCDDTCQIEPFCGDGEINQDWELCDDGNRDNSDSCSNECDFGPVCGNGIVEDGEVCDYGDSNEADGCLNNCTELGHTDFFPPKFYGDECASCMQEKCEDSLETCLDDDACMEVFRCEAEAACVHPDLAALTCLCGEGVSLAECVDTNIDDLQGTCAELIIDNLDSPTTTKDIMSRFANTEYVSGKAHQPMICAARFCTDECLDDR